jgi:hypothetical protein
MIYEYKCEDGHKTEIVLSMKDDTPKSVPCDTCDKQAKRDWSGYSIHIPEHMRANSELYNGDHGANFDYISNRMKKGTRPSGKTKTLW